jgi:glycosyltransferase involved in cell wall biosynthesis
MHANRPLSVARALSELATVDVVTTDFDHSTRKNQNAQIGSIERIVYLKTPTYYNNVSFSRLYSHLRFSIRAALYLRKQRNRYDIVYVTLPFNIIAWYVLRNSSAKLKIVDVVDIWPDVLPFPPFVRVVLAPVFYIWKWFFKSSVIKANLVMAVSDDFMGAASRYAKKDTKLYRFYIGHELLASTVPKQSIITIAYVGNLGRLYDFETLLDVLSEEELRSKVQVFIIGAGDRQDWLIGELERRRIRYRFFGVIFDTGRLAEILRSCHLGFNGYYNTTAAFSYKANTYFAAGLPILNSMVGDLHRLVAEHELGFNYLGGDRNSLKRCLTQINESNLASMAQNCERFFTAQIDSAKIRQHMVNRLREYTELSNV